MTTQERINRITEAAEAKGATTLTAWKALGPQESGLNRINNVFMYILYFQESWRALRLAGTRCHDFATRYDKIVYSDSLLRVLDGSRAKTLIDSPRKTRPGERCYRAALVKLMEPGEARNQFNEDMPGDSNFLQDLYGLFAKPMEVRHRFQKPDIILASYNADDVVPSGSPDFLEWISAQLGRKITEWTDAAIALHSMNESGEGAAGRMESGRFMNPYHHVRGRGIPYLKIPETLFPTTQHPHSLSFEDEDFALKISANPMLVAI